MTADAPKSVGHRHAQAVQPSDQPLVDDFLESTPEKLPTANVRDDERYAAVGAIGDHGAGRWEIRGKGLFAPNSLKRMCRQRRMQNGRMLMHGCADADYLRLLLNK